MSQQIGPGKDLIAAHMIDVMMRVQDSFHVCVVVSDVSCHVLRHLRKVMVSMTKARPSSSTNEAFETPTSPWPWTTV